MKVTYLFLSLLFSFISTSTFGQSSKYVNDIDQNLSIKSVVVSPLLDNVKNIYAPALTKTLTEVISEDHQWTLNEFPSSTRTQPEAFEENPDLVKKLLKQTKSDALISGRISKGPAGLNIKLTLYSGSEGLPLCEERLTDFTGFELVDLKNQISILTRKLKSKIPYQGILLSRKGQLVTLNVGSAMGFRSGMEVTPIQIIKINRHPKFKFLINSDQLILGKIQLNKVDEYLSFGTILSERESGLLSAGMKFKSDTFVQYPATELTKDGKILSDINARPDSAVAFGDKPTEWVPEKPPTFGKLGFLFGLGNYTISNSLSGGGATGTNQVTPSLHVNGEMWLSPNWFLTLNLSSYVFSINNGLSGSSPNMLNVSVSKTGLGAGYNFLLNDDFWGSKIQTTFGYSTMSAFVDNSTPTAYESSTYSGLNLGVAGLFSLPLTERKYPINVGGRLNYYLTPSLSESPTNSGGSTNQITSFSVIAETRLKEKINLRGDLSFDLYSSNFSGAGTRSPSASSASHTLTTLAAGIEYLF